MTKTAQLQIRLSPETKEKLKAIAKQEGFNSVSEFVLSKALPLVEKIETDCDAADLDELARKIHNTEGVPMRVALQRARERLL